MSTASSSSSSQASTVTSRSSVEPRPHGQSAGAHVLRLQPADRRHDLGDVPVATVIQALGPHAQPPHLVVVQLRRHAMHLRA